MTKDEAKHLVETYGKAWVLQNTELVLSIFEPGVPYSNSNGVSTYGFEGIKKYWDEKVILEQKDIDFNLLNIWLDEDTVVAEWKVSFLDVKLDIKVNIIEVAIFTLKENKFTSVRGYYKKIK